MNQPQIAKINNHISIFDIKSSPILDLFLDVLTTDTLFRIECSVKFTKNEIHPCRFHIYLQENKLKIMLNFLHNVKKKYNLLNFNIFKEIFNSADDFTKVRDIIFGIDIRENCNESRIKVWIIPTIDNYELFNKFIKYVKNKDKLVNVIYSNNVLYGFDFYLNGKCDLKLYAKYNKDIIKNNIVFQKITNLFGRKIAQLFKASNIVEINMKNNNSNSNFNFNPINPYIFLDKIPNKNKSIIEGLLNRYKDNIYFTFSENEINDDYIENFNYYYI